MVNGDVGDTALLAQVVVPGIDTVVVGAAITADAAREAREPETILQVNLMALTPLLRLVKAASVRRVINLSSAAVYGLGATGTVPVREDTPPQPTGLYGITKLSSEMVGGRLADLWGIDFVSLRLSGVFGPWERHTGMRDTTSPQFQIMASALAATPALLARPGLRDWIYAPDVAWAVWTVAQAARLQHRLYNVSAPCSWTALTWGQHLAALRPGLECRLAAAGEQVTVNLHAAADRAPLAIDRLQHELGWSAQFGLAASVAHLHHWPHHRLLQAEETA